MVHTQVYDEDFCADKNIVDWAETGSRITFGERNIQLNRMVFHTRQWVVLVLELVQRDMVGTQMLTEIEREVQKMQMATMGVS